MIRSILYATDLGMCAPYVLQHALSLAQAYQARIHVIHVVEPMGMYAESVIRACLGEARLLTLRELGLEYAMSSIEQRVLEGFREELAEASMADQSIEAVRVLQGDPPQVILEQADELAVDLIVLGNHGHGHASPVHLGRTAQRVLALARTPVYLVPMLRS